MPVHDIHQQIRRWIADELTRQAFTDDFGFAVQFETMQVPVQQQPGTMKTVVRWVVLLTLPSGLVGKGRLLKTLHINRAEPAQDAVVTLITGAVAELRAAQKNAVSAPNGHPGPRQRPGG